MMLVAALGAGLLAGAPMRPQEIEELMRLMNQTRVERVIRDEHDGKGGGGEKSGSQLEP